MQILMRTFISKITFTIISFLILVYIFIYNSIEYENAFDNLADDRVPVFSPNTWIFNQNIAQYSTRVLLTRQGNVIVEALAFVSYENEKPDLVRGKMRCVVFLNSKVHIFRMYETISMLTRIPSGSMYYRQLWKLRCRIPSSVHSYNLNGIKIALTDIEEYERLKKSNLYGKRHPLVSFHYPNFYDLKVAKKRSVAHCVHMVHNMNEIRAKRMRNWIEIQKRFGYDRIRLYFDIVDTSLETSLRKEFGSFVDVVTYRLDFDWVCRYSLELRRELSKKKKAKHTNDDNYFDRKAVEYHYENCLKFYGVYFNESKIYMINSHEKICTNDCLLNFKHEYEFTTNYDFDEFIFPRKFNTDSPKPFVSNGPSSCLNSMAKFDFNYSMYEYATSLMQEYGNKIANFHFENVVFLTIPESIEFVEKLVSLPSDTVYLTDASGARLGVRVSKSQIRKIYELLDVEDTIQCLNKTIRANTKLDSIWNVPFALMINNRWGKSLYNTNLTITFNQHHTDNRERGARELKVPLDRGFVSHFREHFRGFLTDQTYSFYNFRLDLEYYQFLAHLSKNLIRK